MRDLNQCFRELVTMFIPLRFVSAEADSIRPSRVQIRCPTVVSPSEEHSAYYVVRDGNGQALAYIYYENTPSRRSAAKLLTKDEGRIAL